MVDLGEEELAFVEVDEVTVVDAAFAEVDVLAVVDAAFVEVDVLAEGGGHLQMGRR